MRKMLVGLALGLLSLIAVEKQVHAAGGVGYVCNVLLNTGASANGNYGSVVVGLYSGPSCSGTYLGYNTFCTAGASASTCTPWPYTEAGVIALFNNLRAAASTNEKITITTYNSNPANVEFWATGY